MIIFPAIDLYDKKAVRLFKGDYREMTVYSDSPVQVALDFKRCGATHIHAVDLEGAKDGTFRSSPMLRRRPGCSSKWAEAYAAKRRLTPTFRRESAELSSARPPSTMRIF